MRIFGTDAPWHRFLLWVACVWNPSPNVVLGFERTGVAGLLAAARHGAAELDTAPILARSGRFPRHCAVAVTAELGDNAMSRSAFAELERDSLRDPPRKDPHFDAPIKRHEAQAKAPSHG